MGLWRNQEQGTICGRQQLGQLKVRIFPQVVISFSPIAR
jgi:hypothetical protein